MWSYIKSNIKNNLFSGLIVIVPLIITVVVLKAGFQFFDHLTTPYFQRYFHRQIPGIGIVIGLVFIYLVGAVTKGYIGRKVVHWGEVLVTRIPVVKTVYTGVKQILVTFAGQGKSSFKKVVLVEYPRKGIFSIGFLNGDMVDKQSRKTLLSVLIMTSINPTSGYVILVPPEQVTFTSLSVEEAMKLIVSGGIVTPEVIVPEANPYLVK